VALGNVGEEAGAVALRTALECDSHTLVRGHAAWGLGQVGRRLKLYETGEWLQAARQQESDAYVLEEIDAALEFLLSDTAEPREVAETAGAG
jgi:HEAT repeat protein